MTVDETQRARVLQILDRYEKPELLLLEGPKLNYILAVRSASPSASDRTYVGGAMTLRRLRDYANGKCDLRFALAHANLRRFWKFEYDGQSESVLLRHVKRSSTELVSSIPDSGIFARDHADIEIVSQFVSNAIERFDIDGGWDLGEFSQFYGQVEDIYYITADIDRFDDPDVNPDERKVISDAFDRSWGGGGSYVAFYRQVANDNDYHAPLRVSGIKYNSPGHVTIHANSEPFNNLMSILQFYSDHEKKVRTAYNELGAFLGANKLKQRGVSNALITDATRKNMERLSRKLSDCFPGISFDTLLEMTEGNHLVTARVLASIFRRVERLYRFFDEGRVAHSRLEIR